MAWVKKNGVGGVGWNFSVGGVGPLNFGWGQKKKSVGRNFGMGLRCFIIKIFLKNSQNLQENICAGVCSLIKFQAEGLKKKRDFSTGVFL